MTSGRTRLTVLGTFTPVARDSEDDVRIRRRFLLRHPKSALYAGFPDFAFWRLATVSAHLNGGFARAADLTAIDIITDVSDAAALIEAEAGAIEHMNGDHAEACRLYATKLLNVSDGDWRCVGIDPDGLELQQGRNALRLDLLVDDQLLNCVEVVSASTTKAILLQRGPDPTERDHATSRGIGVVTTLADALGVMERLQDVAVQRRGRLMRLTDWFSRAPEMTTLPDNPRAVRPIPPFEESE